MNRGLPLALATMFLLAACVIAPGPAERTPDGRLRRQGSRVDSPYVAPGASLARYSRVMFDNVDVGFKPDWQTRKPPPK